MGETLDTRWFDPARLNLLVGLLTRPVAFILSGEMAVAFFGTVLKRLGDNRIHFSHYLSPKWLVKHEAMDRMPLSTIYEHIERADFPFLSANIVDEATGEAPDWLDGSTVINATVDGIAPGDVNEMWLHVEGEDHGWRRYPMPGKNGWPRVQPHL